MSEHRLFIPVVHTSDAVLGVPDGWFVVDNGFTRKGDKVLDVKARKWVKVHPDDLNKTTLLFHRVIRRKPA